MQLQNTTLTKITERMAVSTDKAWDVKGPNPGLNPDRKVPPQLTDAMKAGVWDTSDAERATVEAFNKKYGLKP